MSTKAEQYRADEQRKSQAGKPQKPSRAKTAATGDHKRGVEGTGRRNLKTSPSNMKGGPALESSANGTPSRKSTRRSSEHIKLATNLQRRQVRRNHSSQARAERAAVR
jgi:hypothetical protein